LLCLQVKTVFDWMYIWGDIGHFVKNNELDLGQKNLYGKVMAFWNNFLMHFLNSDRDGVKSKVVAKGLPCHVVKTVFRLDV
jgi:hypothetical protein